MNCKRANELIGDYLDQTLDQRDMARMQAHLADCPACREKVEQYRLMLTLLRKEGPEQVLPDGCLLYTSRCV